MKQYLIYSGTLHIAGFIFLFFFIKPFATNISRSNIYSVDFIGRVTTSASVQKPKPASVTREVHKKEAEPKKPAPQKIKETSDDDMLLEPFKIKEKVVLPSVPSVLKGLKEEKSTAKQKTDTVPSSGEISADFPNFPYPWYITQVRLALYNEWISRMPHGSMRSAVIVFRIRRNGQIIKLKIEKTSKNKLFDFAAMSSAQQAAPFPPLPADYKEKELVVHVEFKVAE